MSVRSAGIFFLLFVFAASSGAAELLWPLPDSRELTSGFGERRGSHFHGGIDIRTQGKKLPCIAVDNGWVERIAISPTGYGRTVYLRLPDGRTAVYAHLSRFAPKIESVVREKQLETGIYRVDFPLEQHELNFERGETIGWTGASGIGAPHLHFELRQVAIQIDPYVDFGRSDTKKPLVQGLRLIEASDEIAARYSRGREIPLEKGATGNRRTRASIPKGTPFALLVKAHDPLPFGQHRPWTRCVLWEEHTRDTLADVHRDGIDLLAEPTVWASVDYVSWRDDRVEWWRLHAGNIGDFIPFRPLQNEIEDFVLDIYDAAGNRARVYLELRQTEEQLSNINNPSGTNSISGQRIGGFELALSPKEKVSLLEITGGTAENEITLQPENIGFYHKATLFYRPPNGSAKRGAYICELKNGKRRFLSAAQDKTGGLLKARISYTGNFGVAQDTVPPTLSVRVSGGKLFFKARDGETKIEDRSVRCRVDGKTAIAQYEPEEDGGLIWTPFKLEPGKHKVVLHAKDKVGNRTELKKTVTVPKSQK